MQLTLEAFLGSIASEDFNYIAVIFAITLQLELYTDLPLYKPLCLDQNPITGPS